MEEVKANKNNRGVRSYLILLSRFSTVDSSGRWWGVLKSLLLLLLSLIDGHTSQTYQILNLIGGAPLYFLPILVAITTANKLKVNNWWRFPLSVP